MSNRTQLTITIEGTAPTRLNPPMAVSWLRMGYAVEVRAPFYRAPLRVKMHPAGRGFMFRVTEMRPSQPITVDFTLDGITDALRGDRSMFEADYDRIAA